KRIGRGANMFLLNKLKGPDVVFFVLIAVVIAAIVVGYFLISLFKRKMYAERRENLKAREMIYKENHEEHTEVTSLDDDLENVNSEEVKEETVELAEETKSVEEQPESVNQDEEPKETEAE
ncbi:MAG: hypothetical protein K2O05_00120, partial [Anaeroplasmataceae bacterium]|nr:hypothetical protein [Anaeroplasmataceae bacterium]